MAGIRPEAVLPDARKLTPGKYFPDTWGCEGSPFTSVPPPDSVMAKGRSEPPDALLALSFETLARSTIAAKWLPESFDGMVYLEHGDDAYRTTTAHLCKAYTQGGCRIVLKGLIGRVISIMQPAPVAPKGEMGVVLDEAAKRDPEEWHTPYDDVGSVPAPVTAFFGAVRDAVLTPAARPPDGRIWERQLKDLVMTRGGIQVFYAAGGELQDPAVGEDNAELGHDIYLWTNGRALVVSAISQVLMDHTAAFSTLQPLVEVRTSRALPAGYVLKSRSEWTTPTGCLVVSRGDATHERLYLVSEGGPSCRVLLPVGRRDEQIGMAAYLAVVDRLISRIVHARYSPRHIQAEVRRAGSRQEALERLTQRRDRCLAALEELERAPCSDALAATRAEVLAIMAVARSQWQLAWPHWEAQLTKAGDHGSDYDAVIAAVYAVMNEQKVGALEWGKAYDAAQGAQEKLGVKLEPWW